MPKTVWKFKIAQDRAVRMPDGAVPLYTKYKGGSTYLWALVDPKRPLKERRLMIVETGETISCSENLNYLGTVYKNSGYRVHHVFEILEN